MAFGRVRNMSRVRLMPGDLLATGCGKWMSVSSISLRIWPGLLTNCQAISRFSSSSSGVSTPRRESLLELRVSSPTVAQLQAYYAYLVLYPIQRLLERQADSRFAQA